MIKMIRFAHNVGALCSPREAGSSVRRGRNDNCALFLPRPSKLRVLGWPDSHVPENAPHHHVVDCCRLVKRACLGGRSECTAVAGGGLCAKSLLSCFPAIYAKLELQPAVQHVYGQGRRWKRRRGRAGVQCTGYSARRATRQHAKHCSLYVDSLHHAAARPGRPLAGRRFLANRREVLSRRHHQGSRKAPRENCVQ